jgi:hypothetical protein
MQRGLLAAGRRGLCSPSTVLRVPFILVAASALLPMAFAHEHGSDHIEEGQAISADPIVCFS